MSLSIEGSPDQRRKSPESLASLLKEEGRTPRYVGGLLPVYDINVLPQARRTFEEIKELAEDIADKGLMNPLIVARFNQEGCERFLAVINHLWQADLTTENLVRRVEKGENSFYILIAGERRLRALRYLQETGCGRDHGTKNCFEYHFPNQLVEIRLCLDIPPLQAIFLQASENIHMRVPPHEEARFHYSLFKLIRQVNDGFSLAAFARAVGRSESTIRNAIKFCELPLDIQKIVEKGYVVYGKALEIVRLREVGLDDEDLKLWIKQAMVSDQTVVEFRNQVTNYIRDLKSGQTMLELFTEAQLEAMRKASIRRVVAGNMIMRLWEGIAYSRIVVGLLREGMLGEEDSPYSIKSPVRIYLAFIDSLETLLPYLKMHLSKKKAEKAEGILAEGRAVLEELETYLPEGENVDSNLGFFPKRSPPSVPYN